MLLAVVGLIAGCSADTDRFSDGFYEDAIRQSPASATRPIQPNPQAAIQPAYVVSSDLDAPVESESIAPRRGPHGEILGAPPRNLGTLSRDIASAPLPRSSVNPLTSTSVGTYTVRDGDTLYSIGRRFGVSVSALQAANSLSDNRIRSGQVLLLGTRAIASPTHAAMPRAVEPSKAPAQVIAKPSAPPPAPIVPQKVSPSQNSETTPPPASITQNIQVQAPQSTGIGTLRWPVQGRILSRFGQKEGSTKNDGLDIMAPKGTSVRAAENGIVMYAGDGLKEFGNTVLILHENNLITVYGYNSKNLVQPKQRVRRGEEIAKSGAPSNGGPPRLHFEVRQGTTPVDPLGYLEP